MKLAIKVGLAALVILGLAAVAGADQSITWVSVSPDRTASGAEVAPTAVSDDGRFVAFATSTNLLPADSGFTDVYVRDMETGSLELVSVSSAGTKGNEHSGARDISISDDGRFVLFGSNADNLVAGDTNNNYDIFVHDRQTGETSVVPRDDGGFPSQAFEGVISGGGRYIGVIGTGYEATAPAGVGIHIYDRVAGTVVQIAQDLDASAESLRISDDGRFVAFTSREFDNNEDIILFDRDNPGDWEIANPRIAGADAQSRMSFISLSGDGRFVAFDSLDTNLVAGDTPGTMDAFV